MSLKGLICLNCFMMRVVFLISMSVFIIYLKITINDKMKKDYFQNKTQQDHFNNKKVFRYG